MPDDVNLLAETLDALKLPALIISPQGEVVIVSRAVRSALGFDRGEGLPNVWPGAASCPTSHGELATELCRASGASVSVKLLVTPLVGGFRLVRVLAGLSTGEAADLFHAQRLEMLGMLAGGVAHDFNNILAGILGHITYLKTVLPSRGMHVESLTAIEEGARKGSMMTQQILNFSRLESGEQVSAVEVGSLVQRTSALLRGALSPEYSIELTLPTEPVSVLAGEGRLAQVLVNLVINARDASSPGSVIQVSVCEERDAAVLREAFHSAELTAERYACIAVADSGHGMPPEVASRVFEPYFSTKGAKGTGLGLTLVASIVRAFGGAVRIESREGQGTTFRIFLPIVTGAPQHQEGGARPVRLHGGDERILIIDDEAAVRNVLALSLQHLGYRVEVAESGLEGLRAYRERSPRFDLVVLDMLMPQLSGEKVFEQLKEFDPKVRVLLISGYSSERAVNKVLEHGGLGFLQKPFTIEELSKRVRSCLDEGDDPLLQPPPRGSD